MRRGPLVRRLAVAGTIGIGIAATALWMGRGSGAPLVPGDEAMVGPVGAIPFAMRVDDAIVVLEVDPDERPYARGSAPPLEDDLLRDEAGIRVDRAENGATHDHPVAQAQDGIAMVEGYRVSAEAAYLDRAVATGEHLLATAFRHEDALYFPYPFDFPLHSDRDNVMRAPWYSGMAQGLALSLFVRLHEATDDDRWREAARHVFRSFLILRPPDDTAGSPWVTFVDESGYYWPEEYPAEVPDRTFNGIVFAAYGLIDYHHATDDPDALLLAQATLTTALAALPRIRVPGGLSRYCLEHEWQDERYHAIHVGQMRMLDRITDDRRFGEWERLLRADAEP